MGPDVPDLLQTGGRRPWWARLAALAGAAVFLALGMVGWLIPVVTGLPFCAVGLVLLALASDRVGRWINRMERRLPARARRGLRRALARITTPWLRRVLGLPDQVP